MIDPELPEQPEPQLTDRTLRQFAGLCVLALGVFAIWRGLWAEQRGWALAAAALAIGLPGLIRPQAIRPIFAGTMAAVYPIGLLTSFLLLNGFFFLIFSPIGLMLRFLGSDRLGLHRVRRSATYLSPKPAPPDLQSYFRQS